MQHRRPDDRSPAAAVLAAVAFAEAAALSVRQGRRGPTSMRLAQPDTDDVFGWTEFGDERVQSPRLARGARRPGRPDCLPATDCVTAGSWPTPTACVGGLVVNPGGPGVAGADCAIYAEQVFSDTLLEHFDIIGFDPRGVGLTDPRSTVGDYDRYYAGVDIARRQRRVAELAA
ncbi:MAG: alpha/beta fold hydrolase [Ilumatobacteraceae bacterium]